jgi:hypothetical protein
MYAPNKTNSTPAAKAAAKLFRALHTAELTAATRKAPAPGATFHVESYINMARAIQNEERA